MLVRLSMLGSVGIRAPEKPPRLSSHIIAARTCEPFRFPARGLGLATFKAECVRHVEELSRQLQVDEYAVAKRGRFLERVVGLRAARGRHCAARGRRWDQEEARV